MKTLLFYCSDSPVSRQAMSQELPAVETVDAYANLELTSKYGVYSVPAVVVVDDAGTMIHSFCDLDSLEDVNLALSDPEGYQAKLDAVIAEWRASALLVDPIRTHDSSVPSAYDNPAPTP
jgi:hypothetical protein